MPLFDPVVMSSLLVLASGQEICTMPKPAEINVSPQTEKVKFVTGKSLAELQKQQIDTINPHSFNGISVTQGYAAGKISMEATVSLGFQSVLRNQGLCVWYDKINVKFHVEPEIYIAREVHNDRCMGKAVLDHEMKHVNVDKQIVNKYSQMIGQKIFDGLTQRGFKAGPIKPGDKDLVAQRMSDTVQQIIDVEMKRLELDRIDMQSAVDTKEEYDRVAAQCPEFEITPDMLEEKKTYGSRRYKR